MLKAEHERAMSLLQKEKAAAAALATAAADKGRRVEAALLAVAEAEADLESRVRAHEEQASCPRPHWQVWFLRCACLEHSPDRGTFFPA